MLGELLIKFQPVLLLTLVLLYAAQPDPPVALLSWIDRYWTATCPEAFDSVNCDPGVLLSMVIRFPAVPDSPKLDTVCVVPAVNFTVAGWVLLVMLLKVLESLRVSIPAPPWLRL